MTKITHICYSHKQGPSWKFHRNFIEIPVEFQIDYESDRNSGCIETSGWSQLDRSHSGQKIDISSPSFNRSVGDISIKYLDICHLLMITKETSICGLSILNERIFLAR